LWEKNLNKSKAKPGDARLFPATASRRYSGGGLLALLAQLLDDRL
jgi:hypothetical protein